MTQENTVTINHEAAHRAWKAERQAANFTPAAVEKAPAKKAPAKKKAAKKAPAKKAPK